MSLVIGAMRRAFGIVRKNLQLFLDFEKSELVSGELVVKDKSPNTNNAKLFTGKALSFDGVNDYIGGTTFTTPDAGVRVFAFSFKTNDTRTGDYQNPFISNTNPFLSFGVDGGKLAVSYYDTSWNTTHFSNTLFNDDALHRAVIIYDIDNTIADAYVDGVYLSQQTVAPSSSPVLNAIGRASSKHFNGMLSDFQIWNAAWAQADVTFDYNNPQHLATDNAASSLNLSNLKGLWHLSEGAGGICYDSSGQGNNGTINGATWLTAQPTIAQLGMMDWAKSTPVVDEITLIANPNNPSQDILGNTVRLREHGFNLDGTGYGEIADDSSLNPTSEITIDAWVNVGSNPSGEVSFVDKDGYEQYRISTQADLKLRTTVAVTDGVSTHYVENAGTPNYYFSLDTWTHVVITFNGSQTEVFIDGESKGTAVANYSSIKVRTADLLIGKYAFGGVIDGVVDEPKIYNRALSQKEIEQNYKAGLNKHKTGSSFSDDFSSDYGL